MTPSNEKTAMQDFKNHTKNQGNITLPKEHNYFSVNDHKEMEIYEFSGQKNNFKIIVLRKLTKL